jgi:FMN phosphatase YigB (HAD superfamily)
MALYLTNLGFGFRHYSMLKHFSKVRAELHRIAMGRGRPGIPTTDAEGFRQLQAELLAAQASIPLAAARRWIEEAMYAELEEDFVRVRLFKGVIPALDRLKAAGLPLAALSDFPVRKKLETFGILDRFDFGLASEETGCLKPGAAPFLEVARRFGLPPSEILYVGNSLGLDIRGAKAVGMQAALRSASRLMARMGEPYAPRQKEEEDRPLPDLVFNDWRLLTSFVLGGEGEAHGAQGREATATR